MNYTAAPGTRSGEVSIPASKSCAHRILICASLADKKSLLKCNGISKDISATAKCLSALCADICISEDGDISVLPSSGLKKVSTCSVGTSVSGSATASGIGSDNGSSNSSAIASGIGSGNGSSENSSPAHLYCGESGSTLRFLLPVVGALGKEAVFHMEGRLPERPMTALVDVLTEHGMTIRQEKDLLYCSGKITPGEYQIPGNISSQYISGLLFALPLLNGDSRLLVTGSVESADYIALTEDALKKAGITFIKEVPTDKSENSFIDNNSSNKSDLSCIGEKSGNRSNLSLNKETPVDKFGTSSYNNNVSSREKICITYIIPGNQNYNSFPDGEVEKDWSNAAFFVCMGAFSEEGITLKNMPSSSTQGDKRIIDLAKQFGAEITLAPAGSGNSGNVDITVRKNKLSGININAAEIPDLVPTLAALAAGAEGTTVISHAERLRIKESDRIKTTLEMLRAVGADIEETPDGLIIRGKKKLAGGTIDSANDHRIAMAAAVAASVCTGPVIIEGVECTAKSYPDFTRDFENLNLNL